LGHLQGLVKQSAPSDDTGGVKTLHEDPRMHSWQERQEAKRQLDRARHDRRIAWATYGDDAPKIIGSLDKIIGHILRLIAAYEDQICERPEKAGTKPEQSPVQDSSS
jgi:hypothetical protein